MYVPIFYGISGHFSKMISYCLIESEKYLDIPHEVFQKKEQIFIANEFKSCRYKPLPNFLFIFVFNCTKTRFDDTKRNCGNGTRSNLPGNLIYRRNLEQISDS